MNSLLEFKLILLVLSIEILLSGCSISSKAVPAESPDTIISETDSQST